MALGLIRKTEWQYLAPSSYEMAFQTRWHCVSSLPSNLVYSMSLYLLCSFLVI